MNAVADDAEFRRLFQQAHGEALTAERQRRRGAAESAADDQDRIALACHHASANQIFKLTRWRRNVNPGQSPIAYAPLAATRTRCTGETAESNSLNVAITDSSRSKFGGARGPNGAPS